MFKKKTFLAIILARAGSKRLPNKNILKLKNKPLIAHSIKSALKSKYIDHVVVSSDGEKILNIAKKYGANTIKRPAKLASDTSTSMDAIKHVLKHVKHYDFVLLLQPTSPLRTSKDIDSSIKLLFKTDANAIISVCPCEHSPLWTNTLDKKGSMDNFLSKDILNKRGQDLPKFYRLNGAIYICRKDLLLKEGTFFLKKGVYAYKMDTLNSIDIDNELDFKFAKFLMEKN